MAGLVEEGIRLARSGRVDEAAHVFERAAVLAPEDAQVMFNAGYAMMQIQRPRDALRYMQKCVEINPNFREAHIKCAQLLRDQGDSARVVDHLYSAIRLEPEKPNAYLYLGDTLNNLKRWNEAVGIYETAVKLVSIHRRDKPKIYKRNTHFFVLSFDASGRW